MGDSDGTSVFTPSDGSTPASTVNVGDFASVYVTAGATVAVFVGRVTTVAAGVNGAITVSTTAKSGTFPTASAGAHTITCKTGGAWKGPNLAVGFPFNFITNALTNVAGDIPRVNLLSGVNYSITTAITHTLAGPLVFQGYTSTTGDGGRATVDGGTSGASYTLLNISGSQCVLEDLIFQNNGASGSTVALNFGSASGVARRVVVHAVRGSGFTTSSRLIECEAYGCNLGNTVAMAGFLTTDRGASLTRCYSHDNTGTNSAGFFQTGVADMKLDGCISESNGGHGLLVAGANANCTLTGCDFYANAGSGVDLGNSGSSAASVYAENCNFVSNGAYGFNGSTTGAKAGYLVNCAFGSGTAVNTLGQTNSLGGIRSVGLITLPSNVTPWSAPTTGNFSVTLAQCKGTGRGSFTETGSGKSGTVGSPDVGAAQHAESPGGGPIIGSVIVRSTRGSV